jgi:hypothetical protein
MSIRVEANSPNSRDWEGHIVIEGAIVWTTKKTYPSAHEATVAAQNKLRGTIAWALGATSEGNEDY